MLDSILRVVTSVNLDSYSSSNKFVGFFEKRGRYKDVFPKMAIDLFFGFFGGLIDGVVVVSSLHANLDKVGFSGTPSEDDRDVLLVRKLVTSRFLKAFSYTEEFGENYESDRYRWGVAAAWNNFEEFSGCDSSIIESLLLARMTVYGLCGHCFLVFDKIGLALYPHDDMGFGVIALNDAADLVVAREFLALADKMEGFHSVVERW